MSHQGLDPRLVYAKTAAGVEEITARRQGLTSAARRILILIDGKRRLSDLPPFTRPGELDPAVDQLASLGLIALAGIADDPSPEEVRERQRREREALVRLQQGLRGRFEQELGTAGLVLEARMRDCVSLDLLRVLLREAVDQVARLRGRESADRMLAVIRPIYAEAWRL